MSFFEELQLSSVDSKNYIAAQEGIPKKFVHILIFLLKVALTVGFSVVFVFAFSKLFGSENSAVGVAVLLCVLSFQRVDLDVRNRAAFCVLPIIFFILAVGPRLANAAGPAAGAGVNAACILIILILGCHRVEYMNHFTFVIGYLLLFGYDVSGTAYVMRVLALALGAVLTMLIYAHKHRDFSCERRFRDLFLDFSPRTKRTQWMLKTAILVSAGILILSILGLPRPMWIGFAIMSVCFPYEERIPGRAAGRVCGTLIGLVLFSIMETFLPPTLCLYLGIFGGLGYGFSAKYIFQTMFNVLGAVTMATQLLGMERAIAYRAAYNVAAAIIVIIFAYFIGLKSRRESKRQAAVL